MKWLKYLPVFLLCIFVSCAGVSKYDSSAPSPSYIEVKNNGWSDVVLYEVIEGTSDRYRLGNVGSMDAAHFKLIRMGESNIYFLIHDIGGQDYTIPFSWQQRPNERVVLTIENNKALSTFSVFAIGS